jgi:hypothetical protein
MSVMAILRQQPHSFRVAGQGVAKECGGERIVALTDFAVASVLSQSHEDGLHSHS